MAMHVKKGDVVAVIAGEQAGQRGRVLRVDPKRRKVLVEGINRVFRHTRRSRRNPEGGRIQKEAPIDLSNVLPVHPKTGRPTRVGFRLDEKGVKQRVARSDGAVLGQVRRSAAQRGAGEIE